MKVALLGPCPVDPRAPREQVSLPGGVDAVVMALAEGLARRSDVEPVLVTAVSGLAQPTQVTVNGLPVYCVPRPRGGRLTGQVAVVSALRRQVTALAPDVVHAHIAGIYARAASGSGRPAVVTLHGIIRREMQQAWPGSRWPVRLRWLSDAVFEARAVAAAREIIAISPYVLTEFAGRTRARFHVVENPVADRFFTTGGPAVDAAAADDGEARLLCVARVIPRKGILALIEAFAQVAPAHPRARLILVGETDADPGYVARLRQTAAQRGVAERVTFLGALPPDEVAAQYASAQIVVLASEQETAPVSIAEAMAAARPVVTTDVGGCAAMVEDGVTGRVVAPRNPSALAAALSAMLADRPLCAAMGQAGRAAAESRFRLAAVVDATLAVYVRVLESGPVSGAAR